MAFGTKYRIEFKDVLDLLWRVNIDVDGYFGTSAPVTSWPEYSNYDTFTTSGYNITSAIMVSGDPSECYSNYFNVNSGDVVTLNINLTLTSGDAPDIYLVNNLDQTKSNIVTLANGANSVSLTPTASGSFRLKIYTTGNTNFAITVSDFISNIVATGDPLSIEMLNNGNDWATAPIHGSKAKIGVYATSDFQWLSLADFGNMTYRVSVYYGTSFILYWRGFIYSDGYEENYDMAPYAVSLLANDGLGLLKNLPFKYTVSTEDDTYYNFRQTEAYIINAVLSKIGITTWQEYLNIYESTMSNGVGNSPLIQTCVDVDLFKDLNCYEVLEKILSKYNAVIVQDRGIMKIYRPEEISQATVYGREFTDVDVYTSVSMAPEQWINRTGSGTPSSFIIPDGGTLSLTVPLKKVTINQDYGSKKSWLDNYAFEEETWNQSTEQFDDWTRIGIAGPWTKAADIIKTEKNGIGMLPNATNPDPTKSVYQEFGIYAIPTDNIINISFSYRLVNADTTTNGAVPIYAKLVNVAGTHWAKMAPSDAVASWDTSLQYLNWEEKDVKAGDNDWITKTLSIAGLPAYGPYYLYLYATEYTIYMIMKDVCFYATADEVIRKAKRKSRWSFSPWWTFALGVGSAQYQITGKRKITGYSYSKGEDNEEIVENEYIVTNAIKGNEITLDCPLGDVIETNIDNILEQFQGALSFLTLVNAAAKFVTDWAVTYLAGGVVVTSSGKNIILTAQTAGIDFTGSTTITNVIGDLSGTVAHTQANSTGQAQITDVTFSGSSGSIYIGVDIGTDSVYETMSYSSSISDSIINFISTYGYEYSAIGVTLSHPSANVMRMTSTAGLSFEVPLLPFGISGSQSTTQTAIAAQKRIDTITLSGIEGTANILCDGTTKLCSMINTNSSGAWSTRQFGTENKPLLEILGDSIRKQYSRPTHLLSLPMREKIYTTNEPQLHLCYNLRDYLNQDAIAADAKYFFINGAEMDVKNREWKLDLVEIVTVE